jgi:hypothetical protein
VTPTPQLATTSSPVACDVAAKLDSGFAKEAPLLVLGRRLTVFVTNKGACMATIDMHENTTATPEEFVAALTDFGPGRANLFPNSADNYLKVHDRGPTYADVTEGSSGIWERLHYDWSDLNRVVMTTTDSNLWGGSSGHTYTLTQKPDGTTDVDVVVVREGKNLKGRLLGAVVGTVGKSRLTKAFDTTVKAIEARAEGARAPEQP